MRFADIMDKVTKLNMFYSLVVAQGIWVMVNIGTFSAPIPASVSSPTSAVVTLAHVLEVGHLVNDVATLKVGDLISPPTSTKRVLKEE